MSVYAVIVARVFSQKILIETKTDENALGTARESKNVAINALKVYFFAKNLISFNNFFTAPVFFHKIMLQKLKQMLFPRKEKTLL